MHARTNSLLSEVMTSAENNEERNDLRCNIATYDEFAKVNCERLKGVEKVLDKVLSRCLGSLQAHYQEMIFYT